MIGWRIGWIVAPPAIVDDLALVSISNVVCPVGIAQEAAACALEAGDEDVALATAEWQRRRDCVLDELRDYPLVRPAGGWSLLLDCGALGLTAEQAAAHLFERGRVAATAMTGWGDADAARYLRLVYANEPLSRLAGLRARVETALGPAGA
jgi:N-succinyldiaminopimelate aminotransferase